MVKKYVCIKLFNRKEKNLERGYMKTLKSLFILFIALSLSACATTPKVDLETREVVSITDAISTREVKTNPSRVAIFNYDILDILDTVGLEAAGIDLLGVPQANLPASLSEYGAEPYKNVGTLFEASLDDLDLFDPELIIIGGRSATLYETLKEAYPNADFLDVTLPNSDLSEGLTQNVTNLATIFPGIADKLNQNLELILGAFDEIKTKTVDTNAMFLLVNANAISYYGPAGRYKMIYDEFGYGASDTNTEEGGSHGKQVSFEYVLDTNPDILFLMDRGASVGNEATLDDILANELIQQTNAAKNGQVYELDASAWYLTSGGFKASLQMIVDMNQYLETIGQSITVPTLVE